jgi:cell division protein ZapD
VIRYEFPLNERVRTLLRLEDLHEKLAHFAAQSGGREHHAAVMTLFEILEVASRADLKSELIQELDRQRAHLEALRNNPSIHAEMLDAVLHDIDRTKPALTEPSGKTGQELRENEWLMAIRQRAGIPGGACEFDLPGYHYWLEGSPEVRRHDIAAWTAPFVPLRAGIDIVLKLLRESGRRHALLAARGTFQEMMGGRTAQLLRLELGEDHGCVPEVSANKYMLNVRFTHASGALRGRLFEQDVAFELTLCNI